MELFFSLVLVLCFCLGIGSLGAYLKQREIQMVCENYGEYSLSHKYKIDCTLVDRAQQKE